jgi:predicted Zn-dependent protease
MKRHLQWFCLFYLMLTPVCFLGCGGTPEESSGDRFRAALDRGDVAEAEGLAASVPRNDVNWVEAQLLLAEKARSTEEHDKSLRIYASIPRDGSEVSVKAAGMAAVLQQEAGQLTPAIKSLRYVMFHHPDNKEMRGRLINIYAAIGQRTLADEILVRLLLSEELSFKQLVLLTDFERRNPDDASMLLECEKKCPDDPAVNLGLAVEELQRKKVHSARRRLEACLRQTPSNASAQGLLGEIIADGARADFLTWYEQIPKEIKSSAEIWMALGMRARADGEMHTAARCFWEAVRKTPASYRATYQLGSVLATIDPVVATVYLKRAEEMQSLRQNLSKVLNSSGRDSEASKKVVELLMGMGREWEAWNWACLAEQRFPGERWVTTALDQLSKYPDTETPRQLESMDLANRYKLDHYPDFQSTYLENQSTNEDSQTSLRASEIHFEDQAQQLGLRFKYHQGRVEESSGVRMFESTGGGVAILDYDADGVSDVFLTQGEDWPRGSNHPSPSDRYSDRLFRGIRAGFSDASASAALSEDNGFGQGCSIGDFDNDGFPDIYVANIGRNQLLRNNGDGTFTDETVGCGISTEKWTSSCLVADLNSDGNPDLYDVNYVDGERIHQADCNIHQCSTLPFKGIPDDIYYSLGDGRFRHVGLRNEGTTGPGLGIVFMRTLAPPRETESLPEVSSNVVNDAGSSWPDSSPSLFVGNDGQANFFLPTGAGIEEPENVGFLRGVAVNSDGRYTSSMGIASGDLDGNGQIDLFITNFSGEANTLFLQQPDGYFVDSVVGTGLMEPGVPMVGWGTQFVDIDCDGKLDIIVGNGHVAEFRDLSMDCLMPPHVFRQTERLRFELLSPASVGEFFSRRLLGRSQAKLDWNDDGLMDVVLTTINSDLALLTNQTASPGHFLKVRLHSVSESRDGLGAMVTVATAEHVQKQQLTAGDGFQASNERVLHFGLAESSQIQRLTVEWPGGSIQELRDLPSDVTIDIVETHTTAAIQGRSSVPCSVIHGP